MGPGTLVVNVFVGRLLRRTLRTFVANWPKSTISWVHEQSVSPASAAFTAGPDTVPGCGEDTPARWRALDGGKVVLRVEQIALLPALRRWRGRGGSGEPKDRRSARQRAASDTLTMQGCRQGACGAERHASAVLQAWHGLGGSGLGGERSGGS